MSDPGVAGDLAEATEAFRSPPPRGGRKLGRRQRSVPYALLAPGGIYLLFAFLIPLGIVVYTSLQSGGILDPNGFQFTWNWSNYTDSLTRYDSVFVRSIEYAGLATILSILLAYPMAYWIAFYGGRWKSTLFFLILLPFFVSFVIRTIQWRFILGDNGLI
ncbi:MAG TPA: ABC transporter permease, partial [Actinomycetota bacterium]